MLLQEPSHRLTGSSRFQMSGAYQKYLVNYQPYFSFFSLLGFYIECFIVVCSLSILIFRAYSYFCGLCCKSSILNKEIFLKKDAERHRVPASDWLQPDQSQPPVGGLTFNDGDPPPNQQRF